MNKISKAESTCFVSSSEGRARRRRVGTLNGLFWGVGIAAGVVTYIRHHCVAHPTDLSLAQYALLFFGACVLSLPIGVLVSFRIMSLGHAKSSSSNVHTPVEMTDSRFRLMLHRWESATAILLVITFCHQLWPVIPRKIVACSMTFSIVTSLFVFLMAGWAAYVRRGRYYDYHAMLGIVLIVATVCAWVLALRPTKAG